MLILDSHVHLYPEFDVSKFFAFAVKNFKALPVPSDASYAICLADTDRTRAYESLADGSLAGDGFKCCDVGDCLDVSVGDTSILVFRAKQLVTQERLEVLSLLSSEGCRSGLSTIDTVDAVLSAGGVPVLAWGAGKWTGKRSGVVRDTIEHYGASELALGDAAMRSSTIAGSVFARYAKRSDLRVLAGSDPLPVAGEEVGVGSYASAFDVDVKNGTHSELMKKLLLDASVSCRSVGKRNSLFRASKRWAGYTLGKR